MNEGVEWAVHSCLNLAWAEPGEAVTAARLAAFFRLPAAYLNKQLQALARAGILTSTSGPRGGFRLAKAPHDISVLDIVLAIEGGEEAFRCTEILRRGPDPEASADFRLTCAVSVTMRRAELAWRKELRGRTLADLIATVERGAPDVQETTRRHLVNARP